MTRDKESIYSEAYDAMTRVTSKGYMGGNLDERLRAGFDVVYNEALATREREITEALEKAEAEQDDGDLFGNVQWERGYEAAIASVRRHLLIPSNSRELEMQLVEGEFCPKCSLPLYVGSKSDILFCTRRHLGKEGE